MNWSILNVIFNHTSFDHLISLLWNRVRYAPSNTTSWWLTKINFLWHKIIHLCIWAIIINNCWLSINFMVTSETSHFLELFIKNICSVSPTWNSIISHQSNNNINWLFFTIINIFTWWSFKFDISLNPITYTAAITSCMSCCTGYSHIYYMISWCGNQFMTPLYLFNWLLVS